MKEEDIKIGETYKIVGRNCGCGDIKCRDCKCFKEHLIKVISKHCTYDINRTVYGESTSGNKCYFAPEDLEPIQTNWRERLENGI